jgi:metal transporter CNNM
MALCLVQSAMFSGLNLALFGVSRLRLEVEASTGDHAAQRVLALRRDAHFALTTVLWGNVAVNVLLTLLSNSVLAGASAFLVSTFAITFLGEILPQGYFSRHALQAASRSVPMLRFYQRLLYPVAKPSAKLLDWWLGVEGIHYFREESLREMIHKHVLVPETPIGRVEGLGALNFLALDDIAAADEGEPVDPLSVIRVDWADGRPSLPAFEASADDPFLRSLNASGKKWVILTDGADAPRLVVDADGFLRSALFEPATFNPYLYCHRPIIVTDRRTLLGDIVQRLEVRAERSSDDVVDRDVILVWADDKRVITGADLLGRLLRGIATRVE